MSRLKFKAAVAKSGAMEADTISKNGRSLKSQMSRTKNFMRKIVFFYWFSPMTIGLMMFSGCATKIPMTTNIVNEVGGVENTKKFQYYVSLLSGKK